MLAMHKDVLIKLHERVTEDATDASIAVAPGANGARVWPEAVKAQTVLERGWSSVPSEREGSGGGVREIDRLVTVLESSGRARSRTGSRRTSWARKMWPRCGPPTAGCAPKCGTYEALTRDGNRSFRPWRSELGKAEIARGGGKRGGRTRPPHSRAADSTAWPNGYALPASNRYPAAAPSSGLEAHPQPLESRS